MSWAMAIPAILGGVGAASGALGSSKTQTQTSNASTKQNSTGGGTSQRILTPEQQTLIPQLQALASGLITDPSSALQPIRSAARTNVNATYAGAADAIKKKYSPGGGGSSGKLGMTARAAELARYGQLAGVDNDFMQLVLQAQQQGAGIGQSLLNTNFGVNSNQYSDSTGTSTETKTGTSSQNPFSEALNGGLGGILGGMQLYKMFNPSGGN